MSPSSNVQTLSGVEINKLSGKRFAKRFAYTPASVETL